MSGQAALDRLQLSREVAPPRDLLPELCLIQTILARAAADLLPYAPAEARHAARAFFTRRDSPLTDFCAMLDLDVEAFRAKALRYAAAAQERRVLLARARR